MTRLHADPITVRRGVVQGGPSAGAGAGDAVEGPLDFTWRGRAYAVVAVLDHWVESGAWWRRAGRAGGGGVSGTGVSGTAVPVLGIDDGEQEVWRVEASTGRRTSPVGVFDLRFEWGSGQWSLIRTHD